MKDTPKATQHCFVLFAGTGVSVRYAPTITSVTALTLEGHYQDDVVEISIGSGGDHFVFNILTEMQFSSGWFNVKATTSGDEDLGLESDEITFTFRVIVYGADRPGFVNHCYFFNLGDDVDLPLRPICYAESKDCTSIKAGSNAPLTDLDGYESGLYVDAIMEATTQVGVRVHGIAARPGVYSFAIEGTSQNTGPNIYIPEGTNAEPIIICIRKPNYCHGDPVMLIDGITPTPMPGRFCVTYHALTDYEAEHLVGDCTVQTFGEAGEETFSALGRKHSIQHTGYADRTDLYFMLDGDIWKLCGRRWFTDQTRPNFRVLATCSSPYFDAIISPLPPLSGWSDHIVIEGEQGYNIAGYGFFGVAGEHPDYGRYYQQQICHTPQWPGWSLPPEYQYDACRYLYRDPLGKWRLTLPTGEIGETDQEVKPQTCNGLVIPYAPPRPGDIALDLGGIMANVNSYSDLRLVVDKYALGIFKTYDWRRQIKPGDGRWPRPTISVDYGATKSVEYSNVGKTISSAQGGDPANPEFRFDNYLEGYTHRTETTQMGGGMTAAYVVNVGDQVDFASSNGGSGGLDYEFAESTMSREDSSYLHDINEPFTTGQQPVGSTETQMGLASVTKIDAKCCVAIGSGPNPATGKQELYTAATATAMVAGDTSGTKMSITTFPDGSTMEYSQPVTGSCGAYASLIPGAGDFIGSDISNIGIPECTALEVTAWCTIFVDHVKRTIDAEGNETTSVIAHTQISAGHHRFERSVNGHTIEQWGHTEVTRDGVFETFTDGGGGIYQTVLAEAASVESVGSVDLNESFTMHVEKSSTTISQVVN